MMFPNLLCMLLVCGLFYVAHLHLDLLIAALLLCISSYRFELWVPIARHWLGMHIMIWSLNGALQTHFVAHRLNLLAARPIKACPPGFAWFSCVCVVALVSECCLRTCEVYQ